MSRNKEISTMSEKVTSNARGGSVGTLYLEQKVMALLKLFKIFGQGFSSISSIVYPADSKVLGITYKQWAPKFWQWWVSLHNARNATASSSGQTDAMHNTCFLNNNSPVIFLANPIIGASVFGNTAHTYECTIPQDKPILVVGIDELCK
jgi:hypothetical protein